MFDRQLIFQDPGVENSGKIEQASMFFINMSISYIVLSFKLKKYERREIEKTEECLVFFFFFFFKF